MPKMIEDPKWLDHKRRVEAERREAAINRRRQDFLRRTTPGTATPATVLDAMRISRMQHEGVTR